MKCPKCGSTGAKEWSGIGTEGRIFGKCLMCGAFIDPEKQQAEIDQLREGLRKAIGLAETCGANRDKIYGLKKLIGGVSDG